ncbi:AlpA family phage regulatory protein [Neisseria weixii]|uniref:AlpA family phage regulatory protein n=1 Tax=Neisseria weixii TaxID=1853276 RepID=A0A3N4MV66_9NEIS|nr:AlpA family phage regulatory protein [Neisseria weixii]RPD83089.1 AlpA family phage regulatory protein [Neisseria weixii]RPD83335.1 AlpA family phage regulatory protein [Neisseria weixii]
MNQENLTAQEVADLLGIGRRTFLQNYATRPDFPDRIRISKKVQFWKSSEIAQWQDRHQEKRPKVEPV